MRFVAEPLAFTFLETAIDEFTRSINLAGHRRVKEMLKALIPEYQPFGMGATAPEPAMSSIAASQLRQQEIVAASRFTS